MKTVGKVVLGAVVYIFGAMLTGMVTSMLHMPQPAMPAGATPAGAFAAWCIGTLLLVGGLVPLVMGLGGSVLRRAIAIFLLVFIAVTVNTTIEASVFSNFVTIGVVDTCLRAVLSTVLLALVLALTFKSAGESTGFSRMSAVQWTWRIAVAWLAFPVIYLLFGMCVAPFVVPVYNAGIAGLRIPPMDLIMRTQLLRSPLFLLSSLPVIALWSGSRKRLLITFGIAEAMMVGVHALAQAYFFPMVLRVSHSIEITADSFVYVALLVWLFAPKEHAAVANNAPVISSAEKLRTA